MATLKATDFAGLIRVLGNKGAGVIGNNTTATLSDDSMNIGVRLHGHLIAVLHADGRVALRDCGYVTQTTYDRLRQLVPVGWSVGYKQGQGTATYRSTGKVALIQTDDWTILNYYGQVGNNVV